MIGKFFADLWHNFKADKLASFVGIAGGLALYVLDFTTGWVTTNLGGAWYAGVIAAVLGLVGAYVRRSKFAPPPTP